MAPLMCGSLCRCSINNHRSYGFGARVHLLSIFSLFHSPLSLVSNQSSSLSSSSWSTSSSSSMLVSTSSFNVLCIHKKLMLWCGIRLILMLFVYASDSARANHLYPTNADKHNSTFCRQCLQFWFIFLQGQATGCYVDQNKITYGEDVSVEVLLYPDWILTWNYPILVSNNVIRKRDLLKHLKLCPVWIYAKFYSKTKLSGNF